MRAALPRSLVLVRVDGWVAFAVPSAVAPALAALRARLAKAMGRLVLAPFTGEEARSGDAEADTEAVGVACSLMSLEVFGAAAGGRVGLAPMAARGGRRGVRGGSRGGRGTRGGAVTMP